MENEYDLILREIEHVRGLLTTLENGSAVLADRPAVLEKARSAGTKYARMIPQLCVARRQALQEYDHRSAEEIQAIIDAIANLCDRISALHDGIILGGEFLSED